MAGGRERRHVLRQRARLPRGGCVDRRDLQAALDAALATPGGNTVLVGDKGSPYVGPFSYQGGGRVINPVTIIADGGRPVLTAGVGQTVLSLDAGTLEGIDVAMPSAAEGIGVQTASATLHDVTVSSAAPGPGATAVQDTGQTVLDHVRVTASGDVGVQVGSNAEALQLATVSAQNLQVSNAEVAVAVGRTGALRATQSQLTAKSIGLSANGSADLDRVAVATTDPSSTGISQSDAGVSLEHVTVAHEGPESGTDTALSLHAATLDSTVRIQHSALAGYSHGIERTVSGGHTLSITAEESVWNDAGDQLGDASAGPVRELGDVHVEPALVNLAAGDLRPRGSSAQIDLDTTTDPTTYTDLVGTPAVDGNGDGIARPDAGALEYRRQTPSIDTLTTPAAGSAGTTLSFDAAVSDADGDHLQVRWDFGDGTSATGTAASHAYAAPGSYQGTLTATNETGLSTQRTFTITVAAAPTPVPPATPVPPVPPGTRGTPEVTVHVSSHITSPHGKVKARKLHAITGTATATLGLSRVLVAIVQPGHTTGNLTCRQLGRDGKLHNLKPSRHTCRPTLFLNPSGTARWTLKLRRQLPSGPYLAISDAVDTAGHAEPIGNSDRASFQLT